LSEKLPDFTKFSAPGPFPGAGTGYGCSMALFDFSISSPSETMTPPQQALWWLKKGELRLGAGWDKAHAICQTAEGTLAYDQVHALAHWIEGDKTNAAYWYRRTGETPAASIEAEWARLAEVLKG
jgi:hypothetical protein